MIKIFLDTEFTGLHQHSSLISLALVAESGEDFYAEFTDYDQTQISQWLKDHVIKNLFLKDNQSENLKSIRILGNKAEITEGLIKWFDQFPKIYDNKGKVIPNIQIWADCYAWDWVLFCELFRGAFGIPKNIHYMTMDLATLFLIKKGQVDYPRFEFVAEEISSKNWKQHNALDDARVEMLCYHKLMSL